MSSLRFSHTYWLATYKKEELKIRVALGEKNGFQARDCWLFKNQKLQRAMEMEGISASSEYLMGT